MAAEDRPPHLQPPLPLPTLVGASFVPTHSSFCALSHQTWAGALQQGLLPFLGLVFLLDFPPRLTVPFTLLKPGPHRVVGDFSCWSENPINPGS